MSSKNKSNKKLLKVSIIVYVLILALVGVYSLAWFVTNKRVEIGVEEEINLSVSNNLEFALIDSPKAEPEWRSKIELITEKNKNYPDITAGLVGDQLRFYYPTVLDDYDNVLPDSEYLKLVTEEDGYYIQMRLKFRTSVNMGVYLTNESFVSPVNVEKQDSPYGNISSDFIAGASRVSFSEIIETDDEGEILVERLKNIWIPNDKYELYYDTVETIVGENIVETTKAFVKVDGERERYFRDVTDPADPNYENDAPYGYMSVINGEIRDMVWAEEDYCSKLITAGKEGLASQGVNNEPAINSAKELLTFTSTTEGEVQEKELVVRIWFEGTDREADKALNGGNVNYNFVFLGIDKEEATADNQTKLNNLVYKSDGKLYITGEEETLAAIEDNILYSVNGIDWTQYSPSGSNLAPLINNEKDYVYVKIRETKTNKETAYVKLTKQNA